MIAGWTGFFGTVTRGELARLGAAVLLGAALAFPAALILAPREPAQRAPSQGTSATGASSQAGHRAMFSPRVRSDPAFLARQQDNAAALEAECRRTGSFCAEARAARRWLDEHGAGR